MNEHLDHEFRKMDGGSWYWIQKDIIQRCAPKIGAMGIAVYNFLASMADRSQTCFPSQRLIAERLGFSRPTIHRALKRLEEHRLIRKQMRDRYHCVYELLHVRCNSGETQMLQGGNSDVARMDTNNTKLTRNTNNIVSVSEKKRTGDEEPKTRKELLAHDIAETLRNDRHIDRYFSMAQRYPEEFLRDVLSQVRQMREGQIRKSRAALFEYLVRHYEHKAN